jgi:hypothetical protein
VYESTEEIQNLLCRGGKRTVDIGNRVQCCIFHKVSYQEKIIALAGESKSIERKKRRY